MSTATIYFEAQTVTHARDLPLDDARRFLLGMLESVGSDSFPRTREAYGNLCFALDQFELIADGQQRIDFGGQQR